MSARLEAKQGTLFIPRLLLGYLKPKYRTLIPRMLLGLER